MLGLYLHIPFCASICNYCNFNRGLFEPGLKERYVDALDREIREAGRGEAVDTVFFGGGTPSLLEPREISRLVDSCRRAFDVRPDAEVTLETNPETSSLARMEGFRAAGVNRVSFGVQSFRSDELARLGRRHSVSRAQEAIAEARGAGIENVSLDLMMWLPGQTAAHWGESIEVLVGLGPAHASLYLLELYPNAPLQETMARAGWSLAPDDDAADMYLWSLERLERAGYRQYEISNLAQPGAESRHNLKYWEDGAWMGFGCGAHSTRDGRRWRNVSGTEDYIAKVHAGLDVSTGARALSSLERAQDALFTGLRLATGVDVAAVGARYAVDTWALFGEGLAPYIAQGILVREGDRIRLTPEGMLVGNEVMAVFV
jgi:oxygen-independent coproporphyrinogen-3 oxidase